MTTAIETEEELTQEAFAILRQHLPSHKIARLLSMWQIGSGDYVRERAALLTGETVDSLFRAGWYVFSLNRQERIDYSLEN